ncbi:MAG: tetratricopeptide repeat protein [Anaerolineae bacterium]|nr:tetratricopeptide repeat protein [Anaerolineae bacterium]
MSYALRTWLILGGLLFTVMGCTRPPTTPASTATVGAPTHAIALNFLVDTTGEVKLKRQGWSDYTPVTFGTPLEWGDLVQVSDTATAAIACADLSVETLRPGYLGGLPCAQTQPVLIRAEAPVLTPRSGALPLYPAILSPRATFLLDPYPRLKWSPVTTQVVTYTVTVRGYALNWQAYTQQTELVYPTDAPALQPGGDGYVLVVEANGHSSEEEGNVFRGFTLLGADQVAQIQHYAQQIAALNLSDAGRRYVTAQMYASQGLRAAATTDLEALVQSTPSPAAWNALANQYLAVGLYGNAAAAYETAQQSAVTHGDALAQAYALWGLGQAYHSLNAVTAARGYAQQALAAFQSLNDAAGIRLSETLLAELGNP